MGQRNLSAPKSAGEAFIVAGWRVDPASLRISDENRTVKLEPKTMAVLDYLACRPGVVVPRLELEQALWAGTVVGYDALSNTIIKLRKAFGDKARSPKIIETIPKAGYRLIAEVESLAGSGPDTVRRFHPAGDELLTYTLPDFDLEFRFALTDFTQVNHQINRVLVRRALSLLEPRAGERIADLFCGIGNFSLAIARSGACVSGIEGSRALVERAAYNARHNCLDALCDFREADLFKVDAAQWQRLGSFDKALMDPPRDGAVELVKAISAAPPARVVYVSCNPATLARDAAIMVHANGYRLRAAGVINMFPHTSHVESIAVFER